MYCKNCGNKLPEGSAFCNKCGAPIIIGTESSDGSSKENSLELGKERENYSTQEQESVENKDERQNNKWGILIITSFIVIFFVSLIVTNMRRGRFTEEMVESTSNSDYTVSETLETSSGEGVFRDSFISDSEEVAVNGISWANRLNGCWVTEQGNWNYYFVHDSHNDCNYILKENIITGEKFKVCTVGDPGEDYFRYDFAIMGDWIIIADEDYSAYKEDSTYEFSRIRTDGQFCDELILDTQSDIYEWFVYDGSLYVILSERTYGSNLEDYIAKVDWITGTYEKIYNLGKDGREDYLGAEDGYVYLNKYEGQIYKVSKISITNVIDDSKIFSYEVYSDHARADWYIYSGKLVSLGYGSAFSNVLDIIIVDFEDSVYQRIEGPIIASLNFNHDNEINFWEDAILLEPGWSYNRDGIMAVYKEDFATWNAEVIIPEEAVSHLSVANDRIYYQAMSELGDIYCYLDLNENGDFEWHELRCEDFEPMGMSIPSY